MKSGELQGYMKVAINVCIMRQSVPLPHLFYKVLQGGNQYEIVWNYGN